ncbi:PAS domain-containing sensor histidine kinase [Sulfurospirillum cavolei]|uniref:PAS domain-containing sensor histidine kinase n=1 Tax=Sulfurospirillum cavolei TaxID=366522 RepID=UPI000764A346|nr:PAS domain-containing sensor histidine kinase [Sulfurospirillum cavolei]
MEEELLEKIRDLELELELLKQQNRRILECAVEEKRSLEALAKKAQLYFNNADLGYVVLDANQCIVDVNETFTTLLGYAKEEVLSSEMRILFSRAKQYQEWFSKVTASESCAGLCHLEYRFRKKSRHSFWAELFGRSFIDDHRTLMIWSIRDISQRVKSRNIIDKLSRKYQKQLRDLETLLDIIPVPVFIKDRYFRYIGCSRSFCEYFGLSKEAIIGKTAFDLYPIEIAKRLLRKDQEMLECVHQVYKITTVSPATDKEVTLEIQKKQMIRNGHFDGFVGVFIDMTESEKQELYLQNRINEEVKKNLQIQAAFQEEMIQNAKFSAIGQMAAGITHEINTPLTYVKGNFEMLLEDMEAFMPDSARKRTMLKDAKTIQEGLERIESIIETMREASQKSREQKEPTNLFESVVSALILSFNRMKQVVGVRLNERLFTLQMPKNAYTFTCTVQKQRIEQVWIIIVNNALDELIKMSTFDERQFEITLREENGFAIVRFQDNAGGIDAKILPRIFEPFESSKESSGIGIGLNIARQIVLQNDGEIVAYNEGGGAVFEVRFALTERSKRFYSDD